ncbi:MAG: hypothetical protein ACE5KS_08240, partial [Woeseiaceae bacterium]
MEQPKTLSHSQAAELLPWLVNDSLDDEDKATVFEHARSCVICRRELASLEQLRDSIERASGQTPIPAPDMRNINARIDALVDRQNRGRPLISRLREFFESPWRVAFAAQTALLLVLAMVLLWPEPRDAQFEMLTQPQELPDGQYLRVVFSPDLAQAGLTELLHELELTIVAGPSSRGVYTLGGVNSLSVDDRDKLMTILQEDSEVLFAQPVVRGANRLVVVLDHHHGV